MYMKELNNHQRILQGVQVYWKIHKTPGNPSLTHQEVVSDVLYEPPTNKKCYLTTLIINAADNKKLAAKIKIA